MPRRTRLSVTALESRLTPATWGLQWAHPEQISVGFVPDGTAVAGSTSNLQTTLDNQLGRGAWQSELLRAFQAWANVANVNFAVVNDAGYAIGSPGPLQGSSAVADIRISGMPFTSNEIITTTPFDLYDTEGGDIVINTNKAYSIGGDGGYDLYTAMLQEVGHTLGLHDSADTASVMYSYYLSPRNGLSDDDIAAVQALYGARQADHFDVVANNDTAATATVLSFADAAPDISHDPAAGSTPSVAAAELTSASDVDYYQVTAPANTHAFTVALEATGISLFQARVSLYDQAGTLVATALAGGPGGNVQLNANRGGGDYTIRVEAGGTAYGVGAYRLAVGTEASSHLAWQKPDEPGESTANDTAATATVLSDTGTAWAYQATANINTSTDVDFYEIHPSGTGTLVVSVWGQTEGGLQPNVTILGVGDKPVAALVVASNAGVQTLQLEGVEANTTYKIMVAGVDNTTGTYTLISSVRDALDLSVDGSNTLTDSSRGAFYKSVASRDEVLHFVLVLNGNADPAYGARFGLYNENGKRIATMMTTLGSSASLDVSVTAGVYYWMVMGGTQAAGAYMPSMTYSLLVSVSNDPIGPQPVSPQDTGPPVIMPHGRPTTWTTIKWWHDAVFPSDTGPWPWW